MYILIIRFGNLYGLLTQIIRQLTEYYGPTLCVVTLNTQLFEKRNED